MPFTDTPAPATPETHLGVLVERLAAGGFTAWIQQRHAAHDGHRGLTGGTDGRVSPACSWQAIPWCGSGASRRTSPGGGLAGLQVRECMLRPR